MGFFGFVFDNLLGIGSKSGGSSGGSAAKSNILFTTSEQIHKALYKITSLNQSQKDLVESILRKYVRDGKLTRGEFKTYILPELYKLRKSGELSEFEYQNIKKSLFS